MHHSRIEPASAAIGEAWLERSLHWADAAKQDRKPRPRRQRETRPLILCGHGISLKVDKGALLVRDGRTHYPQMAEERRFFPGDLDLPERIIVLDGAGNLTLDALSWLSEQGVTLIQLNWKGESVCVIGGSGYAADREKVAWQRATRDDPAKRLAFSCGLIRRKLEASVKTLRAAIPESAARIAAEQRLAAGIARIDDGVADLDALRGIEGPCAKAYFRAWAGLEMTWKAENRHPVPPQWRTYDQRTSILSGKKGKNWKAHHPVNAMLNYAYALLESELRIKALSEGYDPASGIFHHGYQGSPAYLFDLMEPERPRVERAVLSFARSETFSASDFVLRRDGVCRVAPRLTASLCNKLARQP